MRYKIEFTRSDYPGAETGKIEIVWTVANYRETAPNFLLGLSSHVLRFRGRLYIARQIVTQFGNSDPIASIKFGPGGRRLYCEITEKLINDMARSAEYSPARKASEKDEKLFEDRYEFCLFLLDILSKNEDGNVFLMIDKVSSLIDKIRKA